jgi:hypothetical protein
MEIVWAIIVSLILLLIIYGIVSSKIRDRKNRKLTRALLPEINDHIKCGSNYNIHLSCGKKFEDIKFVGFSGTPENASHLMPFPLQRWVVLSKTDGKRMYIKPESIRYYEDV